ncbi:MAG: serine/threonine-protein kinase [Myxococcota bacterium]
MRLSAGGLVGDLRVVGLLGEGSTAEVYLVEDPSSGARYALKLLSVLGRHHRRRMEKEVEALSSLRHPNIVGLVGMVEHEGAPGLLMEYVGGPTLHRWLASHRPDFDEALQIFRGLLAGVEAVHQKGLVHRDLKPGNVLLDVDGRGLRPRIADFGLVKEIEARDRQTITGTAMGTPTYMPPEQVKDASRVDQRADLFSLGCILFELLTGSPPFRREDWWETYKSIEQGEFVDLTPLPEAAGPYLRGTVQALLAPYPEGRPDNAAEVIYLLDGERPQGPLSVPPRIPLTTHSARVAGQLAEEIEQAALGVMTGEQRDLRGLPPTLTGGQLEEYLRSSGAASAGSSTSSVRVIAPMPEPVVVEKRSYGIWPPLLLVAGAVALLGLVSLVLVLDPWERRAAAQVEAPASAPTNVVIDRGPERVVIGVPSPGEPSQSVEPDAVVQPAPLSPQRPFRTPTERGTPTRSTDGVGVVPQAFGASEPAHPDPTPTELTATTSASATRGSPSDGRAEAASKKRRKKGGLRRWLEGGSDKD